VGAALAANILGWCTYRGYSRSHKSRSHSFLFELIVPEFFTQEMVDRQFTGTVEKRHHE